MTVKYNDSGYPEIRKLTRKDRKTLSSLIQSFAERSGNSKLAEMIPSSKKEEEEEQGTEKIYDLMKSVMSGVLEFAEEELAEWFMNLTGIENREEYDSLPFDIEVNILEQMFAQKGFSNFFSKASELFRKIRG